MLVDSIKMGFSDLKKRKIRTVLTSISIAIGTMLLIIMFGLGIGIEKSLSSEMENFGTNKIITVVNREPSKETKQDDGEILREQGKDKKLDSKTIEDIQKIDGVSEIVAENESKITSVEIDGNIKGKEISIIGRDTNNSIFSQAIINSIKKSNKDENYNPIKFGRNLEKNDENAVLIGERYLTKIGIDNIEEIIGKEIDLRVELPKIATQENKIPLSIKGKIVGVVNGNIGEDGYKIITSPNLVKKIQQYYNGNIDDFDKLGFSKLSVECKDISDVSKVNSEINNKLVYGTYANIDRSEDINNTVSVIKIVLIIAGCIVLLVASIGVINTMTMAVNEKTKSIGIMKAQGASKTHITIMFTAQAGVLGFLGGILGSIMAKIASIGLDKFIIKQLESKGALNIDKLFYTPLYIILLSIGFTILICLIVGILPARRAAKLNAVESLRCE